MILSGCIKQTIEGCDGCPVAPENVLATLTGSTVVVSWNSVAEATSYTVWTATSSSDDAGKIYTVITNITATSCIFENVSEGTHYYWVQSCDGSTCGKRSGSASINYVLSGNF
jgi:hypothetical protein